MKCSLSQWSRRVALASVAAACLSPAAQAVELANIDAAGPGTSTAPTLSIPGGQSTASFFVEPATGVGLYPIRIGASRTDDYTGGVLLASSRENTPRTDGLGVNLYGVPGVTTSPASGDVAPDGTLSIYVRNRVGAATNTLSNVNVAAAYFPFSEGWIGATTRNTANGGSPNTTSAVNGVTVNDLILGFGAIESGVSRITIPGVTDTRQQGLLFANHSKNEDNRASVAPSPTGNAFILGMQNAGNAMGNEADPFAFVYMPFGTPNITMASIHGASGQDQHPTVMKSSGLPFTLSRTGVGTYRLSIPGQTPASGSLLINAGGQITAGATSVSDNHFTYQADGDDWVIQNLDWGSGTPTLVEQFLETPLAERSQSFQFAFMPFATPPTAPGPNPTPFNLKDKIFGFNLQETEVDASQQANPNNYGAITAGTAGLRLEHLRQDRGDNSIAVNGFFPSAADGIMFGAISQGFRDNTALPNNPSGQAAYGMIAAGDAGGGWEFATHTADPQTAAASLQEFNVNFSGVFFGLDTPFQKAQNQALTSNTLAVSLPGVNTLNDGVLVAQAFGNVDFFAVATPAGDGSNWTIKNYANDTVAPPASAANWIYLPYSADNLVAGRVAADGTVLSSTGVGGSPGQFTLTKEAGSGAYLLNIVGKTPADGALLLTSSATGVEDNVLVYEAVGNAFRILGVDQVTQAERDASTLPSLEDTNFTFAFIDFDDAPTLNPSFADADFTESNGVDTTDFANWKGGFGTAVGATHTQGDSNADGDVDGGDFLRWQQQFGLPAATSVAAVVPEPVAGALALAALGCLVAGGRRKL